MNKFDVLYNTEIKKNIQKKFNLKNVMEIPKIEKICINMGVGEAAQDSKIINFALDNLKMIAGQKPVICKSKKSNASFKIRTDMPIGVKVTLRKSKMYDFLERLVMVALPRLREFRGFSEKNFDGNGNMSFGITEQIIFPEIDYDKVDAVRGLDITIVTTTKCNEMAKELLSGFFIPFRKNS
jgi:large subunit ribosomal protein L5